MSPHILRGLVRVSALALVLMPVRAQPQTSGAELGLSGYVLAPDGTPVSSGSVEARAGRSRSETSIDGAGRFRLVTDDAGLHRLHVSVPGLAPYRVDVTVPPSMTVRLPVIRLSPATYFRVRFVSTAGEPVTSPRIRRRFLDVSSVAIAETRVPVVDEPVDGDGFVTIGPLPRGTTSLALDTPGLAQTRLPDVHVTGAVPLLDGGTVRVEPGAAVYVDVVDGTGAPVPAHEVFLEDVRPASPVVFVPARTNPQGRATFERVASGPYRVSTMATGRCDGRTLAITRRVSVAGHGAVRTVLVAGGTATIRVTSSFGPMSGVPVSASPDAGVSPAERAGGPPGAAAVGRDIFAPAGDVSCAGTTDADGRVILSTFPPGPARIQVRLPSSTYVRQVNVPLGAQETALLVPEGLLPLRVVNAATSQPVSGAAAAWTAGGARVDARTSATGDALLEGVGAGAGTITVTASGYEPAIRGLTEPPATTLDIALVPASPTRVQARVITSSGQSLGHAVVELSPEAQARVGHIAATNANGVVTFADTAAGAVRLTARADGFVTTTARVPGDRRSVIVMALSRGYRVNVSVELPASTEPQLIRVLNEAGTSMDGFLDIGSARRIQPPDRVSLGPLAPGLYVVEAVGLSGAGEHRRVPVRIVDRDVSVAIPGGLPPIVGDLGQAAPLARYHRLQLPASPARRRPRSRPARGPRPWMFAGTEARMDAGADTQPLEARGRWAEDERTASPSVDVSGLSHPGKVRSENEDHFFVARFGRYLETLQTSLPPGELPHHTDDVGYALVVADGMGGHAAGELASRIAIRELVKAALALPDWIMRLDARTQAEAAARSERGIRDVNAAVIEQGRADPALRGMGSTLTAARNVGRVLQIAHVGDSRAYLLREGRLHRLTRDHTYVQRLVDTGKITPEEAAASTARHVLTNAVGGHSDDVQVDIERIRLTDGDRLLLCSDGLTDGVSDEVIRETLQAEGTAAGACQALVDRGLEAGGRDNITVIVAGFTWRPEA